MALSTLEQIYQNALSCSFPDVAVEIHSAIKTIQNYVANGVLQFQFAIKSAALEFMRIAGASLPHIQVIPSTSGKECDGGESEGLTFNFGRVAVEFRRFRQEEVSPHVCNFKSFVDHFQEGELSKLANWRQPFARIFGISVSVCT